MTKDGRKINLEGERMPRPRKDKVREQRKKWRGQPSKLMAPDCKEANQRIVRGLDKRKGRDRRRKTRDQKTHQHGFGRKTTQVEKADSKEK